MVNLHNKVTVITGAGGGMGAALAAGFGAAGSRLFLSDNRAEQLSVSVGKAREFKVEVCSSVVDLSQGEAAKAMVEQAIRTFGQIDVLINNAGVCRAKALWHLNEEDWDRVLNVNVKGLFFAMQTAACHMLERGGVIINIASVAGRVGRPNLLHYAASKAAVISMTRSAAAALADHNIRVNAIAPGMIDTEMLREVQATCVREGLLDGVGGSHPSLKAIPLGRVGQPEDVVRAALFLAGADSAFVTGQTLNVCGGSVMS
jgi:NAD(P)-dependent dehydrogenase (short-subunit alcohol dehydrogenase family)